MNDFTDKTAVVTGAASGIGLALAEAFARRGARVVAADVEAAALDQAAEQLRAITGDVLAVRTDVRRPEEVEALADATRERFGNTHILCNNAGVGSGGLIETMSLDDWRWTIDVNLWGVIHGLHSFLPAMRASGEPCHVVNTASMAGLVSNPGMGVYNATKQAVVAISETLALECQGSNSEEAIAMQNQITELLRAGLAPEAVAAAVVAAIEENRLYILTHPDFMPMFEARAAAILAAASPAS